MKYTAKFDMDLEEGQIAEELLKKIFSGKIEVKRDKIMKRTGNIFFEISSRGKPSALLITEAKWIFVFDENMKMCLGFEIEDLKAKLKKLKGKAKVEMGGDNDSSLGILAKVQDLVEVK